MKRVIAITALVFIGIFTVSFVAFLVDRTLFNGAIGFLALFSGGVGLALFLVIKLSRDYSDESDEPKDGGSADGTGAETPNVGPAAKAEIADKRNGEPATDEAEGEEEKAER